MAAGTASERGTPKRAIAGRAGRAIRYRCTKQYSFLDLGRSSASTLFVAGTVRSGTTWLAEEVLNHDNRYRMIFEPLNKWRSPVAIPGFTWGSYLEPDDEAPEWRDALGAVVTGKIRGSWIDRANQKRVARHRIVKCVAATNLLPWFHRWHPRMRTIHIVRHPFAVADSVCRLMDAGGPKSPWPRQIADTDDVIAHAGLLDSPLLDRHTAILDLRARCQNPFTIFVLRWCLENFVPLTTIERPELHDLVFYENLVLEPEPVLRALAESLGPGSVPMLERLRRPSRTDFHKSVESARTGSGHEMDLVARWVRTTSDSDRRLGVEILKEFGLDHIYDTHPLPHDTASRR